MSAERLPDRLACFSPCADHAILIPLPKDRLLRDCAGCRASSRRNQYDLVGAKGARGTSKRFLFWCEMPLASRDCDPRCAWGAPYKSGDAKNHHRSHWLRKLNAWTEAAQAWHPVQLEATA